MASSLFHGCLIDFDLHPSNQGLISLVLPPGFHAHRIPVVVALAFLFKLLSCFSNVHWTWSSRCQQRGVEVPHSQLLVPQSMGVSGWFSRGPLSYLGPHFSAWWWASVMALLSIHLPCFGVLLWSQLRWHGVSRWSTGSCHPLWPKPRNPHQSPPWRCKSQSARALSPVPKSVLLRRWLHWRKAERG